MKISKYVLSSAIFAIVGLAQALPAMADNNFSGSYVGADVAFMRGDDKGKEYYDNTFNGYTQNLKPEGVGAGLLAGHNWALGKKIVTGVDVAYRIYPRADIISGQNYQGVLDCPLTRCQFRTDVEQGYSAVGRLGYLITNNALLYGLFGYSNIQLHRSLGVSGYAFEQHKKWQNGWVAGGGIEYLASKNGSVKLEYRYTDLGKLQYSTAVWGEDMSKNLTILKMKFLLG